MALALVPVWPRMFAVPLGAARAQTEPAPALSRSVVETRAKAYPRYFAGSRQNCLLQAWKR
jgi:hypothetical protein